MASEEVVYEYDLLAGIGNLAPAVQDKLIAAATSQAEEPEEDFIALLEDKAVVATPQEKAVASGTSSSGRNEETPSTSDQQLPWAHVLTEYTCPSLKLQAEILEFCALLKPTAEEEKQRADAIARIRELVLGLFPQADVRVFGSFATGLFLPTSDIDLVVMNSGCRDVQRALRAIQKTLLVNDLATNIEVISKAKVPIVKFVESQSGFPFDISFNVQNGPEAAVFIQGLMNQYPAMRFMVPILKLFLQQRNLNEVYMGGIGSYALTVMVAAFLRDELYKSSKGNKEGKLGNLGLLLIDFFRLYGRTLNYEVVGVSCSGFQTFYKKVDHNFIYKERHLLAIMDPRDSRNDLGKSSYDAHIVRAAFDFAYKQLSSPSLPAESLLARIFRLDSVVMSRSVVERAVPDIAALPLQFEGQAHAKSSRRGKSKKQKKREREEAKAFSNEKYYPKHKRHKGH